MCSQWAAIGSLTARIGYTAETLRVDGMGSTMQPSEHDMGQQPGLRMAEHERIKTPAHFAMAELDRRLQP